MPPCRRNFTAPNITEILLRSAPRTSLGELIDTAAGLEGGRVLRHGGKGKMEGKGKQRKVNGMMAGRENLENGEGKEAWPHHHEILIRHCTD